MADISLWSSATGGSRATARKDSLLLAVHRRGPDFDLFRRHRTARAYSDVLISEMEDILEILLAREQGAVAHVIVRLRAIGRRLLQQLLNDRARDLLPRVRID